MSHDDVASSASTFEQFLKAMGPKMKRLLAAHRIPIEDAEDVLQQALLALIYQWDSIRDPESWLLGTLRRNCAMYWRSYRRRLYSAVDSTLLELLSQPMAPPQERNDLLYDLRHMISRLPPRCRSLLELRFQLGYEPAEVARRLGYRDSSIGQVTNRCLAALAREMMGATPATATVDDAVVIGTTARGVHGLGAAINPANDAVGEIGAVGPVGPVGAVGEMGEVGVAGAAGPAQARDANDALPASVLPLRRLGPAGRPG